MKELDKNLVAALCRNNTQQAKEYAKEKLKSDKAQKDELFCEKMLELLDRATMTRLEVPANIKGLLAMENVNYTFNEKRYYLSPRERDLTDQILRLNQAAGRLSDLDIRFVNSTMLYGESGTGKTTFGRYLAYRLCIPFAYMTFSRMIDSHLGQTQKNVNTVFDFVKDQSCVFMIDEIDAIAKKRGSSGEVGEMSRIVISLMQNLDDLPNDVILLGATNRLDVLDEAVLRRFSLKHEVTRLDKKEREEMARKFFSDIKDYSISEKDVLKLAEPDATQAGLTNKIITRMVTDFSSESQFENEQMELLG